MWIVGLQRGVCSHACGDMGSICAGGISCDESEWMGVGEACVGILEG